MKHLNLKFAAIGLALLTLVGCDTKQGTGASIGAGGGAVLGGILGNIIGKDSKATFIGAAIGAAVGSGTGAIIGHRMDKIAQETAAQVQNAKVEQVTDANGLKCIKITFDSGLLFALNKADLNDAAKTDLTKFAGVLKENSDCYVNIYGYTDASGNDQINLPLSKNRALAVENCLTQNGVSSSQFKEIVGKGSADPIEDKTVSQANRRVEVYLYASEAMINSAKNQAGE